MNLKTLISAARLSLAVLSMATATPVFASSDYPDRPIRMIIPFPPGGSLDPIGRVLAEELSQRLKQPVIVENVAGANGMVGSARVSKSPADGYTLLVGITSSIALAPLVTPNPAYQATDFDAIGKIGTSGLVLVGKPDLPVDNLADLLELARKRPGQLSYGVPGSGSLFHLVMEVIKAEAGVELVAVPYRGAGQASVDLMGNQIDIALLGLPAMLPHIASNKMKALAVTSKIPDIGNPDIPVAASVPALKDVDYDIWTGLFAPKGTPTAVRERLHSALQDILKSPKVVNAYAKMGVQVASPQTAAAFGDSVSADSVRLRRDVERTHLKVD
ncbi:Bug family tripartite tricarboxylate transporter substrate binding protein [Achromobacter marplatensis]|uniref:Bug family tripartite tricarboxylate transporter substrate binding protein n=1 Tax=Achromobacter marplatensis TaxID=470868 RepID=UPI0039F6D955